MFTNATRIGGEVRAASDPARDAQVEVTRGDSSGNSG